MPPVVHPTTYGLAGLAALRDAIAQAKAGDALAPVTVVVATNHVGVAARRRLAAGAVGPVVGARAGLAGVTFTTAYRLAERLGAPALAAAGRRPVSTPVLTVLLREVLAAEPGLFAPVAEHPTTEHRLVAAHRELSEVSDPALARLAATSPRAADVVRIHRTLRRRLAAEWYEEQDLAAAAIARLDQPGELDLAAELGTLVVVLPAGLARSAASLVRALGDHLRMHVVVQRTGRTGADTSLHTDLALLGVAPPGADVPLPAAPEPAIEVLDVSDPDDEVRHAVRGVVAAACEGVPLDRLAIVFATEQPYGRLVHEQLAAAGVLANGLSVTPLSATLAGRTLLRLLALADRGLRRDDLSALLAGAPIRWRGRGAPVRAWETASRDAGVLRGLDDWQAKLDRRVDDLAAQRARLPADDTAEARRRALERAEGDTAELGAFVTDLAERLGRADRARSWQALARWSHQLLERYLGGADVRRSWPEAEQRAADRVAEALDRLAGLDAIGAPVDRARFRRTLEIELASGLGRVGRLGTGVLVGRLSLAVGLELDRVWILGGAEGLLPSRPREDSLLPDRERAVCGGELPLRAERTLDEERQFVATLAAVAATGGRAVLTWPRGDLRTTTDRQASRWLPAAPARSAASFTAGILAASFPPTFQEYAMAALVRDPADPAVRSVGHLPLAAEMVAARRVGRFSRFDGRLVGHRIPSPLDPDQVASATRLEAWAACPYAYFTSYILGVEPVEDPETLYRIDPLERGRLVHRVLERFVAEQLPHPPPPHRPWSADHAQRLQAIAEEELAEVERRGRTGTALYWRRERRTILADLARFLDEDSRRRAEEGRTPIATERSFGLDPDTAPVPFVLPDGRSIRLRGSIDRVDRLDGGGYVVTDYKTGAATSYRMLGPDDPHGKGRRLQLALYAHALRHLEQAPDASVRSEYWFPTAKGKFRTNGYDVDPAIQAAVAGAVATITAGIEAGVFPRHPEATTRTGYIPCHACDPDGLGVREARRHFERLATDPALAPHVELTEPELLPAPRLVDPEAPAP